MKEAMGTISDIKAYLRNDLPFIHNKKIHNLIC